LSFICANRFAKNLYGRGLRRLIAEDFHVRYYLNLEHAQPFVSDVSAYPCIAVIDRAQGDPTYAADLKSVAPDVLNEISSKAGARPAAQLAVFPSWYSDGAPWISTEKGSHDRLTALAKTCALLEESAEETRIGIGVATGADRIFVRQGLDPAIERDCQLPLIMAVDIRPAKLSWSEHYLINPFAAADDGSLRDFTSHPNLAAFFERHRPALSERHVARKRTENWYRTIDRVTLSLVKKPSW